MNIEDIIRETCGQVYHTGGFILGELDNFNPKQADLKSANQLVSYVDITAEKQLVEFCKKILPGSVFITEENTVEFDNQGEYTWIIDPLDGTTNFIHGLPVFSVSIGLKRNEKLVGGIVYEINRDEMFFSWEEGPALMNGAEISVSPTDSVKNSLLATGFPYYDYDLMEQYLYLLRELMKGSRGLRRMGSAAVDLAYVACGRFDAFFEYSLKPWDVAAGAFIVQQAGGRVCDFSGGDTYLFGKEIVATNEAMSTEFLSYIKQAFKS